jgi:dihydrofolate reductase
VGAIAAHGLEAALSLCAQADHVWVIGGAQIYAQALPLATTVEVTEIDADFAGDAHAPALGTNWREHQRESHTAANGLSYSFVRYLPA